MPASHATVPGLHVAGSASWRRRSGFGRRRPGALATDTSAEGSGPNGIEDGGRWRETAEDAPCPVPGARADVPQPRDVAASEDRRRERRAGLRLGPARALPAYRPYLRARALRHRVLRGSQLHRRHLHGDHRAGPSQRDPGAGARPNPAAALHGGGHGADRGRVHVLGEPQPSFLRRPALGDPRPPHPRPGRLERGDVDQQQPGRQLRRGAPADRRPLRPRARVHGGLPAALGLVGRGRGGDGPGGGRLRRPRQGPPHRVRRPVLQDPAARST